MMICRLVIVSAYNTSNVVYSIQYVDVYGCHRTQRNAQRVHCSLRLKNAVRRRYSGVVLYCTVTDAQSTVVDHYTTPTKTAIAPSRVAVAIAAAATARLNLRLLLYSDAAPDC